ncbi:hypothetical protein GZL_08379 [Streptomyces sp. 769]|nr:hypothetical protein GZL_08379 [Streptomyces sp. 769]
MTGLRSAQEFGRESDAYRKLNVITRSDRPPSAAAYAVPPPYAAAGTAAVADPVTAVAATPRSTARRLNAAPEASSRNSPDSLEAAATTDGSGAF